MEHDWRGARNKHDVDARFDGDSTRSMEVMGFDTSIQGQFRRSEQAPSRALGDQGTQGRLAAVDKARAGSRMINDP